MKTYYKFLLLLSLLPAFIFHFSATKRSDAAILSKTAIFFAGQDDSLKINGGTFSYPFDVAISENSPAIRNAHIEISGISYNSPSQNQTISADLQGGSISSPKTFTFLANEKSRQFNINYDVTPIILASTNTYTLNITGNATGGAFSIFSAKLVLDYEYDSIQSTLVKTTEFFVGQTSGKTIADDAIAKYFSISIPESSPCIKSAFIEIGGTFKDSGQGTVQAGLFDAGAPAGYKKLYNADLGSQNSSAKFLIRYDALPDMDISNKNYVFYFKADKAINLWNARLYLTYEYSEQSIYPATGYAISSTFDTGVEKGAAYNSIMWNGSLNGGNVRLQFATSDCPNGKTNPPACDDGGTWTYLGNGCSDSTYYESAFGAPEEIECYDNHNNKRYFRYKVVLCSNSICGIGGSSNPQVDNVVVNWAP